MTGLPELQIVALILLSCLVPVLAAAGLAVSSSTSNDCKLRYVCFALDQSGSILNTSYARMQAFVASLAKSVAALSPTAQYCAAAFSENAQLIQSATSDLDSAFLPAINHSRIFDSGTNIYAGLQKCFEELQRNPTDGRVIVLVTDGRNGPRTDTPNPIPAIKAENIGIVTVGVGKEIDVDFLRETATGPEFFLRVTAMDDLPQLVDVAVSKLCDVSRTTVDKDKCEAAFDECEFTFEGFDSLPTFDISTPPETSFTPRIISKDRSVRLGILNSNNIAPQLFKDGEFRDISEFGSPRFSNAPFRTINMNGGSALARRHFNGDQEEVARGQCIRFFFTSFQIVDERGNVIGNVNNVPKSQNKCVVFRTL